MLCNKASIILFFNFAAFRATVSGDSMDSLILMFFYEFGPNHSSSRNVISSWASWLKLLNISVRCLSVFSLFNCNFIVALFLSNFSVNDRYERFSAVYIVSKVVRLGMFGS